MEELVKQTQDGDIHSADQLIRFFYDEIYVYVYKFTYQKEISMDLTQEIFIRMLKNIKKYKSKKGSFKSWLYKLAHNYVINYFNSNDFKKWRICEEVPEYLSLDVNVDQKLVNDEFKQDLNKALYRLDVKYKEIIIMRYFQDLTIDEISSILELNDNTVKTRIRRGLTKLKELLTGGECNE